ncbi:hypothetical protein GGR79_000038 [Xanthomonas arboricola]|nr:MULTISPECIES: hypothetical protein [Xanthomonas]NJC28571.1 hypothetical protein [Xanthomonas arboricola]
MRPTLQDKNVPGTLVGGVRVPMSGLDFERVVLRFPAAPVAGGRP